MLIKIVNGTYGYHPVLSNGKRSLRIVPVSSKSGPIEVDEEEARYLIDAGVASPCPTECHTAPSEVRPNGNTEENVQAPAEPTEATETGYLDAGQLKEMSFDDLKALARDMGASITGIRSKAGLIEAITSVEVKVDGVPQLDAQDVIEE